MRLYTYPVVEVASLRGDEIKLTKKAVDGSVVYDADAAERDLLDVEATVMPSDSEKIVFELRGQKLELDFKAKTMTYGDVVAPLAVFDSKITLRLVLDRMSLEIFANGGHTQIAKCFVPADENDAPIVKVSKDCVDSIHVWPMASVWK